MSKGKSVEKKGQKEPKGISDAPAQEAKHQNGEKKSAHLIRAIRVSQEVLDAAKAYKKSTGISFYQLGLEAITDRLTKEGFLKKGGQ